MAPHISEGTPLRPDRTYTTPRDVTRTHRSDRTGATLQVTVTAVPADPKSAASTVAPLPHLVRRWSTDCRSRCSISARWPWTGAGTGPHPTTQRLVADLRKRHERTQAEPRRYDRVRALNPRVRGSSPWRRTRSRPLTSQCERQDLLSVACGHSGARTVLAGGCRGSVKSAGHHDHNPDGGLDTVPVLHRCSKRYRQSPPIRAVGLAPAREHGRRLCCIERSLAIATEDLPAADAPGPSRRPSAPPEDPTADAVRPVRVLIDRISCGSDHANSGMQQSHTTSLGITSSHQPASIACRVPELVQVDDLREGARTALRDDRRPCRCGCCT